MTEFEPKQLFAELARQLGTPGLALDDNGFCHVSMGDIGYNIEYDAEPREFLVYAALTTLPGEPDKEALRRLHQANYFSVLHGTGSIGLDTAASRVMFVERIAARGLAPADFALAMRSLARRAELWKERVEDPGFGAKADAGDFNPNETHWMMRV